jgi:Sulfotransferase family
VSAKPNFFIVGAGKAGTTSLYRYLKQHPQIYMSPIKEPSYFASEVRAGNLSPTFRRHVRRESTGLSNPLGRLVLDWDEYQDLFSDVQEEIAIGEATPTYLWSETAAANIHACVPHARIIMILRDPSERAFSQYLHQLAEGLTHYTFREQIEKSARGGHRELSILYPFLEIGLYCEQVKRYLAVFPMEQIRIYWYEEAWRQPARLLKGIFEFLDVDAAFQPDFSERTLERRAPRFKMLGYLRQSGIWQSLKGRIPPGLRSTLRALAFQHGNTLTMDPEDRAYLIAYYRHDIRQLAALLDRDLSAWLR